MLPLGSELWVLFFDAQKNNYIPKSKGTIRGVRGNEYLIRGQWVAPGFPHFGSKDEAETWIAANPFEAPTIK